MRTSAPLVVLLLALLACANGQLRAQSAGDMPIPLDTQRTHGSFRIKVLWLLGVTGEFDRIDGTVHFDQFRHSLRVDARIDANHVRMSSPRYERWVKSEDFFDIAHHPYITFASDAFPRQRLYSGGELSGQLTLRGITAPARFELLPTLCARPAYDCPIRVNGTIRRSQFGMNSHRGTLSDRVELDFQIYAQARGDDWLAAR